METRNGGQLFKIGAVARLTGASVHTIRKWEERHAAVSPSRSPGGKRLYTEIDVSRLSLIKKLVDSGLSLHSIANKNLDELTAQWVKLAAVRDAGPGPESIRVAVMGQGLRQP